MTREQAKFELLNREPDFLPVAKQKANGHLTYVCPVCGNGTGKDGDGIAQIPAEKRTFDFPLWHCFKCGLNGDVIKLWKVYNKISDYTEAFRTAYEHYGIIVEDDNTHAGAHSKPTQPRQPVKDKPTLSQAQGARNAFDSLSGVSVNGEQMTMGFDGMNQNVIPVSQEIMHKLTNIVNQHPVTDYVPNYSGNDSGSTTEILQRIWNCSERDVLDNAGIMMEYQLHPERFQAEQQQHDYSNFFLQANKNLSMTDYHRGISLETLNRFCVGFVPDWQSPKALKDGKNPPKSPRLIIPTSPHSYIARDTRPEAPKKFAKMKEGAVHIFNIEALKQAESPIFVVEGEIDALSIIDVGGEAIALGSVSNVQQLFDALKEYPAQQPLIIALDNDEAGKKATDSLLKELKEREITCYNINIAHPCKDANEYLMKDRDAFKEIIQTVQDNPEEAERIALEALEREYINQTSALSHLEELRGGIKADTPCIPTGFTALDKVLDGGLYEGLYFVGAISSLGKTTFVLQIGDQIAQQGNDVLIFSLEMARTELMSKSISRLTLLDALQNGFDTRNAKTARGITAQSRYAKYSQTEKELIDRAFNVYSRYAGNIFIHEGMGNIGVEQVREKVEKHISITGRKPIVIIDYVQILAPANARATDKQNTDKAVLELKRISRDFKIPVIGISSFNRESYSQVVSMASFKESGAIEYSSDVLIGLQLEGAGENNFDATKAKKKNPREIELVILKNRNGGTGAVIPYSYYPMFNYYVEKD